MNAILAFLIIEWIVSRRHSRITNWLLDRIANAIPNEPSTTPIPQTQIRNRKSDGEML